LALSRRDRILYPSPALDILILVGELIDFASTETKVFEVVIQLGAILAVIWIFRQRLVQLVTGAAKRDPIELAFVRNLAIAFLPAAVIGAIFISQIKALFFIPLWWW